MPTGLHMAPDYSGNCEIMELVKICNFEPIKPRDHDRILIYRRWAINYSSILVFEEDL